MLLLQPSYLIGSALPELAENLKAHSATVVLMRSSVVAHLRRELVAARVAVSA
jgi:hypothetical protein